MKSKMKFTLKEIIITGLFAAITAMCAQISIPIGVSPVPITLSLFAVFMSAVLINTKCGVFSQIVYVLVGICGAPVFAEFKGGFHVIAGPKGGYILSYPIIVLVISLILKSKKDFSKLDAIGAMVIGLIICYTLGATWLAINLKISSSKAIAMGVAPYLPLDILKIIVVSVLGIQVRQALVKAQLIGA